MVTFREKVLVKVIERQMLHERGCSSSEGMLQLIESTGMPIRNVCCRMPAADKARLEAVLAVVDMSVQEFVNDAIQDAMAAALGVIQERGMIGWFDAEWEERLKAEKMRLVPSDNDQNQFKIEFINEEGK